MLTRRQLTGLTVAAAGLGLAAILVQLLADVPEPETVLRVARGPVVNVVNGVVWLGVGLVALWRRPDNPLGLIMAAVGAAILLPWVVGAAGSLGFTVAVLVDDVSPVIGAHAFLAFPTGRIPGRPERLVLAVAYLAAVTLAGAEVLLRDYAGAGCTSCPDNRALINDDADVADAIVMVARSIALGAATAMVLILALRWRAASPAARRVLAPVLWTSIAVAALFAFTYAVGPSDEDQTTKVTGIAVAAIPMAFLAGLLRTRLHRSAVGDLVVDLAAPHSPHSSATSWLARSAIPRSSSCTGYPRRSTSSTRTGTRSRRRARAPTARCPSSSMTAPRWRRSGTTRHSSTTRG